jgi:D-alanyl-D-alanine carboxypeptidase
MSQENQHDEIENSLPLLADSEVTSPVPVLPQLSVALGLLVLVFGVSYVGASKALVAKTTENVRVETAATLKNTVDTTPLSKFFDSVDLEAKSAFVWDVRAQRVLFNKNADEQRPLASITKLMTALVAYELLDPSEKVEISQQAIGAEGDSGFSEGEVFTLQNLADLTLIESSNDGATAIGATAGSAVLDDSNPNAVFVHAMNIKAEELGLTKTYFYNSTGLDLSPTEAGAYGSARDVALLMEHIITQTPEAVARTSLDSATIKNTTGEYHVAENTNTVTQEIEGLIASKTGYTTLSGGNLVIAANIGLNRPIIIAVLGSSQAGRFDDALALLEKARLFVENQ